MGAVTHVVKEKGGQGTWKHWGGLGLLPCHSQGLLTAYDKTTETKTKVENKQTKRLLLTQNHGHLFQDNNFIPF